MASGAGAGGSWLAGYAGTGHLGSGSLTLSPSAASGSVVATLVPYGGGTIDRPVQLRLPRGTVPGRLPRSPPNPRPRVPARSPG